MGKVKEYKSYSVCGISVVLGCDLVDYLVDRGVLGKFLYNVSLNRVSGDIVSLDCICSGFVWGDSEEGEFFWEGLDNEFEEMIYCKTYN